jgi:hypothetical protein
LEQNFHQSVTQQKVSGSMVVVDLTAFTTKGTKLHEGNPNQQDRSGLMVFVSVVKLSLYQIEPQA